MAQSAPALPDPVAAGNTLAGLDPTQGALFVLMFVVAFLGGLFIWREFALGRLIKGLDAIAQAMMAVRIAIAENGLAEKLDRAERHRKEDEERRSAKTERGLAQTGRDRAQVGRDEAREGRNEAQADRDERK